MNLNDHAKNVELAIVNYEHGWGQEVVYTYRRSNTSVTLNAFYQEGHSQ